MKRLTVKPRLNWKEINKDLGFDYNEIDEFDYWSESDCYELTLKEVDEIEIATLKIHEMCLETAQYVIDENLLSKLGIPEKFHKVIEDSWNQDHQSIYGRMDLAYDGKNPPKLLEYNADTPTSLLESAVIQWRWMEDQYSAGQISQGDQFNSLHDKLINQWRDFKSNYMQTSDTLHLLYYGESQEDYRTVEYMADVAKQGGISDVVLLPIEQLSFNGQIMLDEKEKPIKFVFKLYPYEWLMEEPFNDALLLSEVQWVEPLWKSIISNKAFLALMYSKFPDSPYLLPTFLEYNDELRNTYVMKPVLGREGANITIVDNSNLGLGTSGNYNGPKVFQKLNYLPQFKGYFVQIGSWIVNGDSAGICIREDLGPIITNKSRFIPHYFVK